MSAAAYGAALTDRSAELERRHERQARREATSRTPPTASRSMWWPGGWAIADDLLVAGFLGAGLLPAEPSDHRVRLVFAVVLLVGAVLATVRWRLVRRRVRERAQRSITPGR
ncbi:hypothetical protein V6N00_16540 [Tersicoccus sp. MR15.9]|uniref:hypothetical protein n=1 Tax=Tersicoccus mangrovi TaxID=3121635 RepID=UPI002FE6BDBE